MIGGNRKEGYTSSKYVELNVREQFVKCTEVNFHTASDVRRLFIFTHRQSCEFLVVSVDSSKNLLTVSLQLLQLLLDDGRVQRFALLNQSVALSEHQLNLPRVQIDLLLEGLRSTNT